MQYNTDQKKCSKCGEVKSSSDFYKHPKDGLQAQCKKCQRLGKRKGNKSREDLKKEVYPRAGYKKCSKCQKVLPYAEFNLRGRCGELRACCKECASSEFTAWSRGEGALPREKLLQQIRTRNRPDENTKLCHGCNKYLPITEFHKTTETFDGYKFQCKECRSAKEKALYQRNKAYIRIKKREYRRLSPAKYKMYAIRGWHKRRARFRSVKSDLTNEQWHNILDQYNNKCVCCGISGDLTIDHIVPISCGGEDTKENIQPLCQSCNSSKGCKTIDYRPLTSLEKHGGIE